MMAKVVFLTGVHQRIKVHMLMGVILYHENTTCGERQS